MAQNLSEAIKQMTLRPDPSVSSTPPRGQATGQLRSLLEASGGKVQAGLPYTPTEESLTETAAAQQVESRARQLAEGADLTQRELERNREAVETGAKLAEQQDIQRQKELLQTHANRTRELLDSARAQRLDLSLDKHRALAEDIATSMRLSNERYIHQLKTEGEKKRLRDAVAFRDELTRTTFGANEELLRQLLGHREILAASDAEFSKALAEIDIETALKIAEYEAKAAQMQAIAGGISSIVGAGVMAASYAPTGSPTKIQTTVAPTAKEQSLGMSIGSPKSVDLDVNKSSLSSTSRF